MSYLEPPPTTDLTTQMLERLKAAATDGDVGVLRAYRDPKALATMLLGTELLGAEDGQPNPAADGGTAHFEMKQRTDAEGRLTSTMSARVWACGSMSYGKRARWCADAQSARTEVDGQVVASERRGKLEMYGEADDKGGRPWRVRFEDSEFAELGGKGERVARVGITVGRQAGQQSPRTARPALKYVSGVRISDVPAFPNGDWPAAQKAAAARSQPRPANAQFERLAGDPDAAEIAWGLALKQRAEEATTKALGDARANSDPGRYDLPADFIPRRPPARQPRGSLPTHVEAILDHMDQVRAFLRSDRSAERAKAIVYPIIRRVPDADGGITIWPNPEILRNVPHPWPAVTSMDQLREVLASQGYTNGGTQ